jgi:hypothetical protein
MWIALYGLQPTGVPDRSSVSIRKLETGFGLNPALPHPCEVPINLHQDPRQFLLVTLLPTTPQALVWLIHPNTRLYPYPGRPEISQ